MATQQDCSIGFGVESSFKTYTTPTRWLEIIGDESLGWNKNVKQSEGLKVGSRVARSRRRTIPTADGGGDINFEAQSKGMGLIWRAILGAGTSTNVSGATYQQNFTMNSATPDSVTIQKGIPLADGTVTATTFLGCVSTGWEFSCPNGDIARLKTSWDAADITTAESYVAPSYATTSNLFHFANGTIYTGTLTAPTSTALASATEEVAGVRSFSVGNNNNPDVGRFNFGGSGRKDKALWGVGQITGSLEAEYVNTDFRDAVLDDSPMALLLEFTAGSLSTGLETLQVVIPEVKFDSELAKMNGGELVIQNMSFMGLDNEVAAQPIYVVHRTSDTAL